MAGHVVVGTAVVLQTLSSAGGGETYLYKGAPVIEGVYKAESLKHALAIGLIAEVPDPEPTAEELAAAKAAEDKAAADKAAADKAAADAAAAKAKATPPASPVK